MSHDAKLRERSDDRMPCEAAAHLSILSGSNNMGGRGRRWQCSCMVDGDIPFLTPVMVPPNMASSFLLPLGLLGLLVRSSPVGELAPLDAAAADADVGVEGVGDDGVSALGRTPRAEGDGAPA